MPYIKKKKIRSVGKQKKGTAKASEGKRRPNEQARKISFQRNAETLNADFSLSDQNQSEKLKFELFSAFFFHFFFIISLLNLFFRKVYKEIGEFSSVIKGIRFGLRKVTHNYYRKNPQSLKESLGVKVKDRKKN